MKKSKYNSRKVSVDGIKFDSVKEARRYRELKFLEKGGEICNLRLQVPFELLPNQYECYERYGKRGQRLKDGKRLLERKCVYIADFTYTETKSRKYVVEDAKGHRTPDYLIKRKLMLYIFKIKIKEV